MDFLWLIVIEFLTSEYLLTKHVSTKVNKNFPLTESKGHILFLFLCESSAVLTQIIISSFHIPSLPSSKSLVTLSQTFYWIPHPLFSSKIHYLPGSFCTSPFYLLTLPTSLFISLLP